MVFDYRNNREEVLKSGVIAEDYNRVIAKEKVIEGYTFRNFTSLKFDKTKKINKCIFENCKNLDFFNAWIEDCTFNQIGDSINLEKTELIHCGFSNCGQKDQLIVSVKESLMSGCTFDNVTLGISRL